MIFSIFCTSFDENYRQGFSVCANRQMNLVGVLLISGRPTGSFQGSMTLFLVLFSFIAFALIGVGVYLYNKRKDWIAHSKTTYGKIVEISRRYARDDHSGRFPIYFPIVSYYVNGAEFRREAEKGLVKNCEIGQQIPVRYLMDNPYEASLSEKSLPVLNPTVFFVLGILMLVSSIILSFLQH